MSAAVARAGVTARQRKDELERLNDQLRKINMSLRQQARAGTLYAPGLTYVPPTLGGGGAPAGAVETMPVPTPGAVELSDENDSDGGQFGRNVRSFSGSDSDDGGAPLTLPSAYTATAATAEQQASADRQAVNGQVGMVSMMMSMDDEEQAAEARQCLQALKEGKRCARSLRRFCTDYMSSSASYHVFEVLANVLLLTASSVMQVVEEQTWGSSDGAL